MKQKQKIISQGEYKLKTSQRAYVGVKVFFDALVALIAIILLSPIFIITAIAIKIDSKGPVFFCQQSVGKNGKIHTLEGIVTLGAKLFRSRSRNYLALEDDHHVRRILRRRIKEAIAQIHARVSIFFINRLLRTRQNDRLWRMLYHI